MFTVPAQSPDEVIWTLSYSPGEIDLLDAAEDHGVDLHGVGAREGRTVIKRHAVVTCHDSELIHRENLEPMNTHPPRSGSS